jgi:hypothetical protein
VVLAVVGIVGGGALPAAVSAPRPPARWDRLEIEITRTSHFTQKPIGKEIRFGFRVFYVTSDEGVEFVKLEHTAANVPTTLDRELSAAYVRAVRRAHKAGELDDSIFFPTVALKLPGDRVLALQTADTIQRRESVEPGEGEEDGPKTFHVMVPWSIHKFENGTMEMEPKGLPRITDELTKQLFDDKEDEVAFVHRLGGLQAMTDTVYSEWLGVDVWKGEYQLSGSIAGRSFESPRTAVHTKRKSPFADEIKGATVTVRWKPKGAD